MFVPALALFSALELGCISHHGAGESSEEALCFPDLRLPDKRQQESFSSVPFLLWAGPGPPVRERPGLEELEEPKDCLSNMCWDAPSPPAPTGVKWQRSPSPKSTSCHFSDFLSCPVKINPFKVH